MRHDDHFDVSLLLGKGEPRSSDDAPLFEHLPEATPPEAIATLLPMNAKPLELIIDRFDLPLKSQAL